MKRVVNLSVIAHMTVVITYLLLSLQIYCLFQIKS